jgi:hypothetical protein
LFQLDCEQRPEFLEPLTESLLLQIEFELAFWILESNSNNYGHFAVGEGFDSGKYAVNLRCLQIASSSAVTHRGQKDSQPHMVKAQSLQSRDLIHRLAALWFNILADGPDVNAFQQFPRSQLRRSLRESRD